MLHTAIPASGLRVLTADDPEAPPPYWAYQWAGGTVLARYILDHPGTVAGLRVLDLGAGSGLVAIAAAKAGARTVTAAEINPHGLAALALNAAANGVAIAAALATISSTVHRRKPTSSPSAISSMPRTLRTASCPSSTAALRQASRVLVGDPYRKPLPLARLELIAEYEVPDFGSKSLVRSGVFSLRAPS